MNFKKYYVAKAANIDANNIKEGIIERLYLEAIFMAFGIVNSFLFIGIVIVAIIKPGFVVNFPLTDIDFGILFIIQIWAIILEEPLLVVAVIFGFIVAAIWSKRQYGSDYSTIMMFASQVPSFLLFFSLFSILIIFYPVIGSLVFTLLTNIFFNYLSLFVISFLLSLIGIIVGTFITYQAAYPYKLAIDPFFLELPVSKTKMEEPRSTCPFKYEKRNGCSYLGYEAREGKALICDYQSTFTTCPIYSHIYYQIQEGEVQ